MMTNQKILEKAIQKAIDGGWSADDGYTPDNLAVYMLSDSLSNSGYALETVIFNHDFAKALWPPKPDRVEEFHDRTVTHSDIQWKKHLQNMVVSSDPIKYLGENI